MPCSLAGVSHTCAMEPSPSSRYRRGPCVHRRLLPTAAYGAEWGEAANVSPRGPLHYHLPAGVPTLSPQTPPGSSGRSSRPTRHARTLTPLNSSLSLGGVCLCCAFPRWPLSCNRAETVTRLLSHHPPPSRPQSCWSGPFYFEECPLASTTMTLSQHFCGTLDLKSHVALRHCNCERTEVLAQAKALATERVPKPARAHCRPC